VLPALAVTRVGKFKSLYGFLQYCCGEPAGGEQAVKSECPPLAGPERSVGSALWAAKKLGGFALYWGFGLCR